MDLNNTIRKDCLVVLKEGVSTFTHGNTEFKPHTFYRSIYLTNDTHKEIMIYGEIFVNENFDNSFELAYDKIIRDFKSCGLIKPNGKPTSKAQFKRDCRLHEYTNRFPGKLFKGLFMLMKDREMYSFQTNFRENKTQFYNAIYGYLIDIINGDLTTIDNKCVQFGNRGIGFSYSSNLGVRDTTKDKPFIL